MTDIVERLRDRDVCSMAHNSCRNDFVCEQAADTIEALRAEHEASVTGYEIACDIMAEEREALRAENARLTKEAMSDYHEGWEEGCTAMKEENVRLREALKPFADLADKIEAANDDDDYHFPAAKISDLRAARAAMGDTE